MAVKAGYKRTEVGIIPEDWEVRSFAEHFKIYAGGDVPKHSLSDTQSPTHPFPIFANALSDRGLYGYTAERRSSADSVTITARGYLGHAEYRSVPFFPIVRLLVLEPTGKLDARFTAYSINELVEFAVESTGVPQLTAPQVGKYSVAAPPTLKEQRAIAAALSDVDALLDGLDRLIAKKRDLKQATMQQLLTGQTRLPGFGGDWKEVRLADVADFCAGTYLAQDRYRDGPYDVQGAGASMGRHDTASITKPLSVVGRVGTIGKPRFFSAGCWVNNNAAAVVARPSAVPQYVHLLLLALDWSKVVSVTAQPFLVVPDLMNLKFMVPSRDEQTAIARVLSDMDAELTTLEARRDKTKNLKKAMMQELLTGKTRLVNGGARV